MGTMIFLHLPGFGSIPSLPHRRRRLRSSQEANLSNNAWRNMPRQSSPTTIWFRSLHSGRRKSRRIRQEEQHTPTNCGFVADGCAFAVRCEANSVVGFACLFVFGGERVVKFSFCVGCIVLEDWGEKWTDGVGAAGFVPCRLGRSAKPVRSGDRERSEADCVRVSDVNGLGREDLVSGIYLAERLNKFLGDNWKSFATQNYFDPHGLFLSTLWSGHLMVIAIVILVNRLFSLCHLIVRWKKAELRHIARLSRNKQD
ncbi:hypothetical protein NL676_036695 [Syzygium grande]|nr:hypothetical protein NL676_036695 [Syzygium grande]